MNRYDYTANIKPRGAELPYGYYKGQRFKMRLKYIEDVELRQRCKLDGYPEWAIMKGLHFPNSEPHNYCFLFAGGYPITVDSLKLFYEPA